MKGFTLIEVLVVVGLVAIVGALGFSFDFDNFRASSFYTERDSLLSSLWHARSQAISNICRGTCSDGESHGVKILPDKFVIFQGTTYDPNSSDNMNLEASPNIKHTGLDEVVFSKLSGNVANPGDIILTDEVGKRKSTISISSVGQILWQDERI